MEAYAIIEETADRDTTRNISDREIDQDQRNE
jgi:hypothetical protein